MSAAPFSIEDVEKAITDYLNRGEDNDPVGRQVDANACIVTMAVNASDLSPYPASSCDKYIGFYSSLRDENTLQYKVSTSSNVSDLINEFDALRGWHGAPPRFVVRQVWQSILHGF